VKSLIAPIELWLFGGGGHEIPIVGFLVAGFWALFAVETFRSTSDRTRDVWTSIWVTFPSAVAGMHHALSVYETLIANAVTYGWSDRGNLAETTAS